MNKYLAKRNELAKELEKEFNKRDYEIFTEMEIANELDGLLDNDYLEFNFNLTTEQQEELIEIIYDFYMECESNVSVYSAVKAVLQTITEFDSYLEFKGKYETDYSNTYDKIVWNL
nr:MAG TPA: hypothetical protein [Caudoviricetes sp.]